MALLRRLGGPFADERPARRRKRGWQASIVGAHHDVKVAFSLLPELHLDLVGFRVELDLIDLEIVQLGNQLLAGDRRPPPYFGVENLLPFLAASLSGRSPLALFIAAAFGAAPRAPDISPARPAPPRCG